MQLETALCPCQVLPVKFLILVIPRYPALPIDLMVKSRFSWSAQHNKSKQPQGCSCSECPYSTSRLDPFPLCSSVRGTCTSRNWTSPVRSETAWTEISVRADDAADLNDSRNRRWRRSDADCGREDRSTVSLPVLPTTYHRPLWSSI